MAVHYYNIILMIVQAMIQDYTISQLGMVIDYYFFYMYILNVVTYKFTSHNTIFNNK